eukprot:357811-Chlamydomonas_euryale.AAC.5
MGLGGVGGVVGRPRFTWQDRAVAALSPVLTSWLAGWGGMGWHRTVRSGVPFVTAPSSLFYPLCLVALNTGKPIVGPPNL